MRCPRTWRLGHYVLTGTARQRGSRTFLSLSLTNTESDTIVWRDRLSTPFDALVGGFDDLLSLIEQLRTQMSSEPPAVSTLSKSPPRKSPAHSSTRKSATASKTVAKPRRATKRKQK